MNATLGTADLTRLARDLAACGATLSVLQVTRFAGFLADVGGAVVARGGAGL
jgi:hypothetical protein